MFTFPRTVEYEQKRIIALRKAMKRPEIKRKQSLAKLGNKNPAKRLEVRIKISKTQKGKPSFHKGKPFYQLRGDKHWNWQGGKTKEREKLRKSLEYKIWRTAVFERDNYTCLSCRQIGGYLQADHIKPWSLFPELRFEISNGRTLCYNCHKQTDTYLRYFGEGLVRQS